MHIDHSKLIELLVETSGIEKEKVESQLADLVEEINEAIEEGEAYEVDGFGVFSAIGNNVVFIPADELATEINYKYVGMEAIEMDDATDVMEEPDAQDEDDPFAGLLGEEPVTDSADEKGSKGKEVGSPFDIEDEGHSESEEESEEKPGPDKWGIDTYKDEGDEGMFSGLLGDAPKEETEQEEEHFKAVFDQEDDGDEDLERISEIERELSGDIDDQVESEPDEEDTDPFAALAEGEDDENEDLEKALGSAISSEDDEEPEDLEEALSSSISEEADDNEDEPVPVIKNLTSEKSEIDQTPKKDDRQTEKNRKPFKRPQKANESGSQSAILIIIIIILVLGGGIYGLGYFGMVNIPGITPAEVPATTQTTPPAQEDTEPLPGQSQNESMQEADTETAANELTQNESPGQVSEQTLTEAEQGAENPVSETQDAIEETSTGEASYGLTGSLSDAANNGYTIVLYSLTNEDNARAKVSELSDQGYRAILAPIPHQQYGTLWRVSIGQFETMRDAALAAQDLGDTYTDNYFVTQIQ